MTRGIALIVVLFAFAATGWCADAGLSSELEFLKNRVAELEARLNEHEAQQVAGDCQIPVRGGELKTIEKSIKNQETRKEEKGTESKTPARLPVRGEELKTIKDTIMERLGTLSIHGAVLGYYQGRNDPTIDDRDYSGANGAGFVADLELAFQPFRNGELFMRIHAGEGEGADKDLAEDGGLFANLNTIADDNPGDDGLSLLEVFYTQTFCNERYLFAIGKTEQVLFIDDNTFANDEYAQFVGKPFVNNPMLDSEVEYGPLMAAQASPWEQLTLTFLYESTSRPNREEDMQKSIWSNVFDTPFLAAQATYSPKLFGLQGNYRLYGWGATYDHYKISGDDTAKGWGVGLSLDQMVHEKLGLFARFAYSNEDVYEAPWLWSVGTSLKGLIPYREEDEIGLGIAGLEANGDLGYNGTEIHFEGYYRFVLSEHFSITPDIQFVANPRGESSNDNVVAGMLKGQFTF